MRTWCFVLALVALVCFPVSGFAADEPAPADPFDALVEATSQLADLAQQLKPASQAVDAKAEAVSRKETELAETRAAAETAKADFNAVLAAFISAIDTLKAAALEIQPIDDGTPPEEPAPEEPATE